MSDSRAKDLIQQGDQLFSKRSTMVSLWQEIAEQFYVERATFTASPVLAARFADYLTTSYPLLARRELGDAIGGMLRPKTKEWFKIAVAREERLDDAGRAWLEYATKVQRRAMYDRAAMLARATKEGDHDFASFGQCALSTELNGAGDTLLYRCWHLRDVAWCESAEGKIDTIHRKWKPAARDLVRIFGKTGRLDPKVAQAAEKDPYCEIEVRHIVIPADGYEMEGGRKSRAPYVSLYVDAQNGGIIEERPSFSPIYSIPRWQTVSGSQYAYSPATIAALPDARLIQAMTLTLLEAGEKSVNPPMIATQEAIRSDLALYAGGVTYADSDYDERKGDVLRPIKLDMGGIPLGIELQKDTREMIAQCFYLNKLSMPMGDNPEMTAFEVGQRVQQYIREALPLFEPLEQDYNGSLCEQTFDLLFRGGAFGSMQDIPPSLRGQEIQFRFESPLTEAVERVEGQRLIEAKQLLAQTVDLDPTTAQMLDAKAALRDALRGIGTPAKWLRSEDQMAAIADASAKRQQADAIMGGMERAAGVANQLGQAGQAMKEAGFGQAEAA